MDLRTQTSLIASVLCFALATSVLLRPRKRRVHWLFAVFGLTVASWYLTTFLGRLLGGGPVWDRVNLTCAVLLPLAAVQFFRAFVEGETRRAVLFNRAAIACGAVIIGLVMTPIYRHIAVRTAVFGFVGVLLAVALAMLYVRGRAARSRFESARMRYLALAGALAALFTLVDYLPYVGLEIPPIGTVLTLVFLYVLSQSILRYRLLDLYELAGRLSVLTALSFTLAAIFWVLVYFAGERFFLHSVVAALVVLLLFDPVRGKVEEKIAQILFRERYDLEQTIQELRRRLAHVLDVEDMTRMVLAGLERSRRFTHAAIYLVDEDLRGYNLVAHEGPEPVRRVETAPARPLLDRLGREEALVLETLERELDERRELGDDREAETIYEILQTLEAMSASVCLAIKGERAGIYGFLAVRDERLRDAFTPEEVALLRGLAVQMAIAVENSRLYQRLKERDRLAALGEMAAGLAHEIRNPLGAIKASAQFIAEDAPSAGGASPSAPGDGAQKEFLDIIVEEVDRLNRVVSSFLDYARPSRGDPEPTDVNATVRRTMQLLGTTSTSENVKWELRLDEQVPPVRVDVEQLRQVLINLVQNAVQAMEAGGELIVETAARERDDVHGQLRRWVEIRVTDTGPGIPQKVLKNLFVPFVTTKDRGTGLGLAISQRIVSAAGGHIEVRTHAGVGTTFVVRLPVADEAVQTGPLGLRRGDLRPESERAPPPAPAESGQSPAGASSVTGSSVPSTAGAAPPPAPPSEPVGDDSGATERASGIATSR